MYGTEQAVPKVDIEGLLPQSLRHTTYLSYLRRIRTRSRVVRAWPRKLAVHANRLGNDQTGSLAPRA